MSADPPVRRVLALPATPPSAGQARRFVRGVLAEYGADSTGSALEPFAEPGACRVVIPPAECI